jgi:hypothetical protein
MVGGSLTTKTGRHDIAGILLKVALNTKNQITSNQIKPNRIGGVMVSVLSSSAVNHGFEPQSGQIKDYKIGICYFSAKHVASRRKNKDWLARNQENVSEWGDKSIHGLLFQRSGTIKTQLRVLV